MHAFAVPFVARRKFFATPSSKTTFPAPKDSSKAGKMAFGEKLEGSRRVEKKFFFSGKESIFYIRCQILRNFDLQKF
jgi:hypothetical protein